MLQKLHKVSPLRLYEMKMERIEPIYLEENVKRDYKYGLSVVMITCLSGIEIKLHCLSNEILDLDSKQNSNQDQELTFKMFFIHHSRKTFL